jgi:hypothetical protein
MSVFLKTVFLGVLFLNLSHAFTLTPEVNLNGQQIRVQCSSSEDSFCVRLCGDQNLCEIKEGVCRSCAGTQSLWLKRVLEGVGILTVSSNSVIQNDSILKVLQEGSFMTLHPQTIYNFSSSFNGSQIRSQFNALCEGPASNYSGPGILFIQLNPYTRVPEKILGAACTEPESEKTVFLRTRSQAL